MRSGNLEFIRSFFGSPKNQERWTNSQDKANFIESALHAMARHTHPCVAALMEHRENVGLIHVGSAIHIRMGERLFLVTSLHVVEDSTSVFRKICVASKGIGGAFELAGVPAEIDKSKDVAVYVLPQHYPLERDSFWPIDRMDAGEENLSSDLLVIQGYPLGFVRVDEETRTVEARSIVYGVMPRNQDLPYPLPIFQFAADLEPGDLSLAGANLDIAVAGLSGSPVWRLGATHQPMQEWTPELSSLVGLLARWIPKDRVLVAVKSQAIGTLLGRI